MPRFVPTPWYAVAPGTDVLRDDGVPATLVAYVAPPRPGLWRAVLVTTRGALTLADVLPTGLAVVVEPTYLDAMIILMTELGATP
jgi:hypothetical protein